MGASAGTPPSSCGTPGGSRSACSGCDNPWWTGHLYAPEGTYLTAHPLETLLMVLVSPVTALAGPMITYGLLVLVTLAAAGVLAWRLGLAMGLGDGRSGDRGRALGLVSDRGLPDVDRPLHAASAGRPAPGRAAARAAADAQPLHPRRRSCSEPFSAPAC